MMTSFQPDELLRSWLVQGRAVIITVHVLGIASFAYIVARRLNPLLRAQPDPRFGQPMRRLGLVMKFWLGQWKHPRYKTAGILHILIFSGFLLLAARAFTVLLAGVIPGFTLPGLAGARGHTYESLTDYAATVVFLCMVFAIVRRLVFKPARYALPATFGKSRGADAIFLLALIAILMLADSLFEGTAAAAQPGGRATLLSLPWLFTRALRSTPSATLGATYLAAYLLHQCVFYFLLCYRPFGIQFHVETSLFNVYFAKLDREQLKPVRWGVPEEQLDGVKSFGVKSFEDFTWKHLLDFYSCADCGRCSDNCPAHAAGRPLSPRLLSIKARDYAFRHYPMLGRQGNGKPLVGTVYSADEIWSCTTCGACEEECPLLVEYVDKIVDLRRGLVDDGNVPQSLQKALKSLESRGNPYGKQEKKRGEWASREFQQICPVKTLDGRNEADTLYFVDSITSYDDRMRTVARATATILNRVGADFGILGPAERDSGHEVRRFGEEMLFLALREHNADAIRAGRAGRIVTADPHAFNALKRDYRGLPPVEHITQVMARALNSGQLSFNSVEKGEIYTYHDPCYLGRHNHVYDEPRQVLDAIPGLARVEMKRSRDRSFCCGGGGLMLFYEAPEEQRMGVKRVQMAAEAGANVMVTACPFCLVNMEDAIKVAGLEGKMRAIDVAELAAQQLAS